MNDLANYYSKMLTHGLLSIREAVRCNDLEWVEAEVQLLHNIPSLLDEPKWKRHQYFWSAERQSYIDWAGGRGREAQKKRMKLYYEPIWREMEPILLESLANESATSLATQP
jgi:hypothetical protein